MKSLKKAAPLLARVTAFIIFVMILFSCVSLTGSYKLPPHSIFGSLFGVQAFKGSLRRSCQLRKSGCFQPKDYIYGENYFLVAADGTSLLNFDSLNKPQSCGGHINATTLTVSGFIHTNNRSTKYTKGYVCSLGQVCMVRIFLCVPLDWIFIPRCIVGHGN